MIVEEARTWIGTPFVWGQSAKDYGCDCKGLIAGVARELGRPEANSFYAAFSNYRVDRPVPVSVLLDGMAALFDRVDEMEPGDILLLKHSGSPGHLAIYAGDDRAIHAYPSRYSKVMERDLRVLLHKHPLHSIWRWRELVDAD